MLAHKMYILCVLIHTLGFTAGVAILNIYKFQHWKTVL